MKTYKVISLGNIRNTEGDYEVNDAHYTGHEIELPDNLTIVDIMRAMKDAGIFEKHVTRRMLYTEDGGDYSIFLRRKSNHAWLYELRDEESLRKEVEAVKEAFKNHFAE